MIAIPLDPFFTAFGVSVTVTRPAPDDDTIATSAIWVPTTTEDLPGGEVFHRRDPRRVLALKRDEVPVIPIGTTILAPELPSGPDQHWRVDGFERSEVDLWRVVVVPIPEEA